MVKSLLIIALFSSCTRNIYSIKYDDGHMESLSLLWRKSGEYRGAFAGYKMNQNNWSVLTIQKANCDSFRLDRWQKSDKKGQPSIGLFHISKMGMISANLSYAELKLMGELRRVVDSLGWCHTAILCCPDSLFLHEIPRKKKSSR